jgi:CHAT domain-containing protein
MVEQAQGSLAARAQALFGQQKKLNDDLRAAMMQVATHPSEALDELAACLETANRLEPIDSALLGELGAFGQSQREASRQNWLDIKLSVHASRRNALKLLARDAELRPEIDAERALIGDWPDHPGHAFLAEAEAELTSDPGQRDSLLDQAFAAYQHSGRWLEAGQNRMRAAGLARIAEDAARFRACCDAAIDIAGRTRQKRGAFDYRVFRFQGLLISDTLGHGLETLRGQLNYTSRLRGALADDMERGFAEAFACFDKAQAALQDAASRSGALAGAAAETAAYAMAWHTGLLEELAARARANPDDPALIPDAAAALNAARSDLEYLHRSQRISLLLLAADFKQRLNDWDTPVESILPEAEALAAGSPENLVAVLFARADACDGRGALDQAIAYAQRAVEASGQVAAVSLQAQATAKLEALLGRSKSGAVQQRTGLASDEYISRRVEAATRALSEGRSDDAIGIYEAMLPLTDSVHMRQMLLMMRGTARFDLGQFAPALADFTEGVALLPDDTAASDIAAGDGLIRRESAILLKAMAQAALHHAAEAWTTAESGRSLMLRTALGAAPPSWEAVRAWLGRERAAVLTLVSNRWGTLAMSCGPGDTEPEAVQFKGFGGKELRQLLQSQRGAGSVEWTRQIFGAAKDLSVGLLAPLADRLRQITADARILYIIPHDLLFYAPFAAMEIEPGVTLAETIPFAIVPSLSVLLARAADPDPHGPGNCLAVAAGKDLTGADFAPHLRLVAAAPWPEPPDELSGEVATAAAVTEAVPHHDILYMSCHGRVDDVVQDVMSASCLALGGETELTARAVEAWSGAPGLVFLNACQAGRFRQSGRTELGGFPGAFIRAGSRTVIAPLTHVDPDAAGTIAEVFFRALPAGQSPAEALRQARLMLKARGRPPEEWAAHVMFGVDRVPATFVEAGTSPR